MEKLLGIIIEGELEGCRVLFFQGTLNIFGKNKNNENIVKTFHFDDMEDVKKKFNIVWDNPCEKRKIENEVVDWWVSNYPKSKKVLFDTLQDFEENEEVGIYNLFRDLLHDFYEKNLQNKQELQSFLDLYEKFLIKFLPKFQYGKNNDLEEMTGIEMFEWLNKGQLDFVNSLTKPGKLKDILEFYYQFLTNL